MTVNNSESVLRIAAVVVLGLLLAGCIAWPGIDTRERNRAPQPNQWHTPATNSVPTNQ